MDISPAHLDGSDSIQESVHETDGGPEVNSARPSIAESPRKRRKLDSTAPATGPASPVKAKYNDAYRIMLNQIIETTASGQDDYGTQAGGDKSSDEDSDDESEAAESEPTRVGPWTWTHVEKAAFFTALARSGRDDIPRISRAVGTKTELQARHFLLTLQDGLDEARGTQQRSEVSVPLPLQDIPAAFEISGKCDEQLEGTADILVYLQDQYDAEREKARYPTHWLITTDLAEAIDKDVKSYHNATKSPTLSPMLDAGETDENAVPLLLQEIPEAALLAPTAFLELSHHLFMNPSADMQYPWPNWRDLESEFTTEPSIYRTAFRDIHALTVSMTKRILQAALFQAESRIRTNNTKPGRNPAFLVTETDVFTAVDLLGLKRNRRGYWAEVVRRCRVRVVDGKGSDHREVSWDDVELLLDKSRSRSASASSLPDAPIRKPDREERSFKARAKRRGTPLPRQWLSASVDSDSDDTDETPKEQQSDANHQIISNSQTPSLAGTDYGTPSSAGSEDDVQSLEDFDRDASRQEELQLWKMLGTTPAALAVSKAKSATKSRARSQSGSRARPQTTTKGEMQKNDDWRSQTQYRAEWEVFEEALSDSEFAKTRKPPGPHVTLEGLSTKDFHRGRGPRHDSDTDSENDRVPSSDSRELPLRGARAYAAMQSRNFHMDDQAREIPETDSDASEPVPSIEQASANPHNLPQSNYTMDWE